MPHDPSQQEMQRIGDAVAAGQAILAIKIYREITGCGLRESKDFIDKLTAELRASQPERFAAHPAAPAGQAVLVYWMIWFAFMMGEVIIYNTLSKQSTPSPGLDPSYWYVACAPFVVSAITRWTVLPRFKRLQSAISPFIIGIAFAETSIFFGLYLFPAYKEILFVLGLAGTAQYIPVFARKLVR